MRTITLITLLFISYTLFAQGDDMKATELGASYTADFGRNFSGGLKQDNMYLGLIALSTDIDLQKAGLWKGASFHGSFLNTHGRHASAEVIGDAQAASNITNDNATFIMDAYYKQALGKVNLFIGKHDLNGDFTSCSHSCLFLNGSAGVVPNISGNLPVSIFPRTSMSVGLIYEPKESLSIKTAVYDAMKNEDDQYSADFIPSGEEYLSITEAETRFDSIGLGIKAGFLYETSEYASIENGNTRNGNYALYCMMDKNITSMLDGELYAFAHLGYSPEEYNEVGMYYSGGFTLEEFAGKHSAGLVYGHMQMTNSWGKVNDTGAEYESFIEATASFSVHENISIQPDIQYIINPGVSTEFSNALVGFIRVGVEF